MLAGVVLGPEAQAKPLAPEVLCESYAGTLTCSARLPECTLCHETFNPPVTLNPYGDAVRGALLETTSAPFDDQAFADNLPQALADIDGLDSDDDGFDNGTEIESGTHPGKAHSVPTEAVCPDDVSDLDYKICEYDARFAYRRVGIDFCGLPPTFAEMEAFAALTADDQLEAIHTLLDQCLDSEFWLGVDGVLWQLAHDKVRPITSLNGFAEFDFDYAFFTYTQIDGHDVRDMLVGQYLVQRVEEGGKSLYQVVDSLPSQPLQTERRVGMMLTSWTLFYNTMFTAMPRGTAAQAYRSFLGFDIAQSEGLFPVQNEPVDYDAMGVQETACASCHSTLDPLSYPFATYNGLQSDPGGGTFFTYDPDRIEKFFVSQFPGMATMPESGAIFGQPVDNLVQWAQVAAASDAFLQNVTRNYWELLVGREPSPERAEAFEEFTLLWQSLDGDYSVEAMLHRLVETEAYGAP